MSPNYQPSESELNEILNIKYAHSDFLKKVEISLKTIYENNKQIFRRPPEVRIKKTKSILENFDKDGDGDDLIKFVKGLRDIAGARMTITTKDEFTFATKILQIGLREYGELDIKTRENENGKMNKRGYSAYHYFLNPTKKNDGDETYVCNVSLEIQVRTLAQDLWAVFEHPERYKGNQLKNSPSLGMELMNYAKLMDVADDIAQLTKNRKKHEAERYYEEKRILNNISIEGKEPLDIDVLNDTILEIVNRDKSAGEEIFTISTFEVCDLLIKLCNNNIYTVEDFKGLLLNEEYNEQINCVLDEMKITKDGVGIINGIILYFLCREKQIKVELVEQARDDSSIKDKKRKSIRDELKKELKFKIKQIKDEMKIDAYLNNYDIN